MAVTIVQSKPYVIVSGPESQGAIENLLDSFTGAAGSRILKLDVQVFLQLETLLANLRTQLEAAEVIDPLP
jgi:hypothetical protein